MWKMVLSDLRHGIKPGLKKVFQNFINFYIYLYLMFLTPVFLKLEGKYWMYYYFAVIPMIVSMLLFTMYGGRANKALYLCPLSKKQRKQYFLISWGVRAGLPPLLALLLEGALCISGEISFLGALLVVLSISFFSLPLNLHGNMQDVGRTNPKFAHYSIWYIAVLILGVFSIIFLAAVLGDVEDPRFTGGEIAVSVILFCGQALTALTMFVKYFHSVMEGMACYENVKDPEKVQAFVFKPENWK